MSEPKSPNHVRTQKEKPCQNPKAQTLSEPKRPNHFKLQPLYRLIERNSTLKLISFAYSTEDQRFYLFILVRDKKKSVKKKPSRQMILTSRSFFQNSCQKSSAPIFVKLKIEQVFNVYIISKVLISKTTQNLMCFIYQAGFRYMNSLFYCSKFKCPLLRRSLQSGHFKFKVTGDNRWQN